MSRAPALLAFTRGGERSGVRLADQGKASDATCPQATRADGFPDSLVRAAGNSSGLARRKFSFGLPPSIAFDDLFFDEEALADAKPLPQIIAHSKERSLTNLAPKPLSLRENDRGRVHVRILEVQKADVLFEALCKLSKKPALRSRQRG